MTPKESTHGQSLKTIKTKKIKLDFNFFLSQKKESRYKTRLFFIGILKTNDLVRKGNPSVIKITN